MDAAGELSVARLRLVGAVVVAIACTFITMTGTTTVGWTLVVLGYLIAIFWVVAYVRGRARSQSDDLFYLDVGSQGFHLKEGMREHLLTWEKVKNIRVDEDRLDVLVEPFEGEPIRIEPRYEGVSVYDLCALLEHRALPIAQAETHSGQAI